MVPRPRPAAAVPARVAAPESIVGCGPVAVVGTGRPRERPVAAVTGGLALVAAVAGGPALVAPLAPVGPATRPTAPLRRRTAL